MQRSRRTNPYPFAWEIPLAAVVAAVLILVLGVHSGRAVANLFAGNGWALTPKDGLLTTLPGLLGGDAAVGLPPLAHPASAAALRTWTMIVELLVVVAIWIAVTYGLRRWGPGPIHGMASKGEAEQLLGRTRLRKTATIIRPDLHAPSRRNRP